MKRDPSLLLDPSMCPSRAFRSAIWIFSFGAGTTEHPAG